MDADIFDMLRDTVRRFVNERLIPAEDAVEEADAIPADIVSEIRTMGLFGLSVPEEFGGLGCTMSGIRDYPGVVPRFHRLSLADRDDGRHR